MSEIIKNLQNIQENLVGIILPVAITALVSLITVITNAYIQIKLQNYNFNSQQYQLMQDFYPKLKKYLLQLKLTMEDIESSQLYSDFGSALDKYTSFSSNESKYRKQNANEMQYIDIFAKAIKEYCEKSSELYNYLFNCTIPKVPIGHYIFKKKTNKMLTVLQYYSLLSNMNNKNGFDNNFFKKEFGKFEHKWKIKFNSLLVEKYLLLLDKWLMKY